MKLNEEERLDLAWGEQAAWYGDGMEMEGTLSSIVHMNLFNDVAGRVNKSQGIWQMDKHTGVVEIILAVTFRMEWWSCKNKKKVEENGTYSVEEEEWWKT